MSFPSDGRNHLNAIKNEKSTTEFLKQNAHKLFSIKGKYVVDHKGGTTNKADNIITTNDGSIIFISDKEKKKGLNGSFDYTNSSAAIKDLIDKNSPIVSKIKTVIISSKKDRLLTETQREKLVNSYRKSVKEACYYALSSMNENVLLNIIKEYLIETNKYMHMLITDGKNNNRYLFPFSNHPILHLIKNEYKPSIKVKEGASSGRILFQKGSDIQDTGLRIRIHTNNGVNALLGNSKTNKNSSFVLKFQQDNIPNLLKVVKATKYGK
jgi:hypothetical protein